MSPSIQIQLVTPETELRFNWSGFDGDDCFDDFRIDVTSHGNFRRFEFGPCAVRAFRKLKEFLSDSAQTEVGGGFRHSAIRYYDIYCSGGSFRLVVRFEGSSLHQEFVVHSPVILVPGELNVA